MSKLKAAHIYVGGLVILLIVGLGLFFALISPAQADVSQLESRLVTLQRDIGGVQNASELLKQAEKNALTAKSQWLAKMNAQNPPSPYVIPAGDQRTVLSQMAGWWLLPGQIVREARSFAHRSSGVRVQTEFAAPGPSPDPRAIPQDVLKITLGPMSATGSFKDVLNWARRWSSWKYTNAVDNLNLQLVSRGRVRGTATLTVYIFPKGEPGNFQPGQGQGGGGGMMGGMGGMMGGSGGMMGGSGGMMGGGTGAGPTTQGATGAPGIAGPQSGS